jgi:UDP-N-acetylglucosamine acyltransferase
MAIHPLSAVDPKAEVHPEATVGPFCVVGANVRLAAGVELRNHVTVYGRCSIGTGTVVFPGAVIGGDPQDLKYKGEDSEVVIGEHCRIHECATINKGTVGGGLLTRVGNRCLIMAYAHLAHDCLLEDHVIVGNNAQLAGHCRLGRKAIVSGMVGLHHFVSVGELAFVGAMSGVRYDVPPYVTVEGYPAEPRSLNLVGLRRDQWEDVDIQATKDAFRILYRERGVRPLSESIEIVKASEIAARPPVKRLCDWLTSHLNESVKGRALEALRTN